MWKRKDLKSKAKKVVTRNYWTAIIVCFLLALFTGEFGTSIILIWQGEDTVDPNYIIKQENIIEYNKKAEEELQEIKEGEKQIQDKKDTLNAFQLGIIKVIKDNINNIVKSEKYVFRIWDAIKSFEIKEVGLGILLIIIAIIAIAYIILIAEVLRVSGRKYFIEARKNENTKAEVMKETFKKGNWKNVAYIMLMKDIYNILWYLTIIGGFIKSYEYRMIPYILADNPKIKRKDAFKISKEMMRGNKWKTFVLDVSFILWNLLSFITFGIANILYVNPYKAATVTELYETLKENAKDI